MPEPSFSPDGKYTNALDMSEPALFVVRLKSGRISGRSAEQEKSLVDKIEASLSSFDPRHRLIKLQIGETLEPVEPAGPVFQVFPGVTDGPWEDDS